MNKRTVTIKIRMTKDECDQLCQLSDKLGQSYSKTVREAIDIYSHSVNLLYPPVPEEQPLLPGVEGFYRNSDGTCTRMTDQELRAYLAEHPEMGPKTS